MNDPSDFHRSPPNALVESTESADLADPADIPSPPQRALQEELAAQARPKDRQDFGTLPQNLMEAVLVVQAMEREGKLVHRNREALMDFLRERPGDTVSADLLAAMALVLEAIPERRRAREKSTMGYCLRRVWENLLFFIRKALNVFKTK